MENQTRTRYEEEEMTIDLMELLQALRRRLWAIVLAALIGGGIAGAFSKFVLTPQYTSTSTLYILSKETTLTSLADLQIGSQLTQDYKILVTSRPVLETVIEEVGLDMRYEGLKGKISIGNPSDTRILTITVQDSDPQMAKTIVDAIADTASEYIGDIMEMIPPKIVEYGVVPTVKSSPSNSRNAVMGAMLGMVLVCGLVAMEVILNDTIRSEEDVEKYLGLTVLASVPDREETGGARYGGDTYRRAAERQRKKLMRKASKKQKQKGGRA